MTDIGNIWWTRIANPVRLIDDILNSIYDGKSVAVKYDETIPWYDIMRETIISKLEIFSDNKSFTNHEISSKKDPGEFLMEKYCSSAERSNYWPKAEKEEFLAKSKSTTLNNNYIFVSIEKSCNAASWVKFVDKYTSYFNEDDEYGMFILYTNDQNIKSTSNVDCYNYSDYISNYDCLMLCMTLMSAGKYSSIEKQYISEVAGQIAGNNENIAGQLVQHGRNLVQSPITITENVFRDNNVKVKEINNYVNTALWNAQIKTVFPKLEQYRAWFIQKHQSSLEAHINLVGTDKYKKNNVVELEIGEIYYICKENRISSKEDFDNLVKVRNARNLLAHWNVIPYKNVIEIFNIRIK